MEERSTDRELPRVLIAILSEGSPRLGGCIVSALAQDYPALEVLVVDVAGTGAADQVARRHGVPVIASPKGKGLAAGANAVLYEPIDHCEWVVYCHDEVALEPDAVRQMVESAMEADAAVVGPKVRDWSRPEILREVGFGCDRYGYHKSLVDPGESDRGQHDLLRDVFFVSTTCMGVRLDALAALGGFDASLDSLEADLDLCWRARLTGYRVVVVPAAVAYHEPSNLDWPAVRDPHSVAQRNRLRVLTKCYRPLRLLGVLLSLALQDAAEAGFRIFTGKPPGILRKIAVWGRYLLGLGSTLRARSSVQRQRVIDDSAVAESQSRGSVRIRSALERRLHVESEEEGAEPLSLQSVGSGVWEFVLHELTRPPVIFWVVWTLFVGVCSRGLLASRSIPVVGELGYLESGVETFADYFRAWHPDGVGYSGHASPSRAIVGLLQVLVFGRSAAPMRVLLPVAFLLGAAGVWTSVRRVSGHLRWEGAAAATVLYSLSPPVVASYEKGSMSGVVTAALLPWALVVVLAPVIGGRQGVGRAAALVALLTFVMTSFEPLAPLLLVASALAICLVSVVAGKFLRALASLAVGLLAGVAGAALTLPWALAREPLDALLSTVLSGWPDGRVQLGIGGALRMQTTEVGSAPLGYAAAAVALSALVFCRGDRLAWASRFLVAAAPSVAAVWFAGQGKLPAVLESFPAVFVPTAIGFAVAGGLAIDDLRERATASENPSAVARLLVWPLVGLVAIGSVHPAVRVLGGTLGARSTGFEKALEEARTTGEVGDVAVLWLGSQESLPGNPRPLSGGVGGAYSVTGSLPTPALARYSPEPPGFEGALAKVLSQVQAEGFTRGGRLLSSLGVRYVAIPEQPGRYPVGSRPLPEGVVSGLSRQLDISEVRGVRGLRLFRVAPESAVWTSTAIDSVVSEAATASDAVLLRRWREVELTGAVPAFTSTHLGARATVAEGRAAAVLLFKEYDERLRLVVEADGAGPVEVEPTRALGWASLFDLGRLGQSGALQLHLRYDEPEGFREPIFGQIAGVVLLVAVGALGRRQEEGDDLPERLAALAPLAAGDDAASHSANEETSCSGRSELQ